MIQVYVVVSLVMCSTSVEHHWFSFIADFPFYRLTYVAYSTHLLSTFVVHSASCFLIISHTLPAVGYAKTKVHSAENPALPKVLSVFRGDVPSVDFVIILYIYSHTMWELLYPAHNGCSRFQSAYRPGRSTETTLLKIVDDLLLPLDAGNVFLLVFWTCQQPSIR